MNDDHGSSRLGAQGAWRSAIVLLVSVCAASALAQGAPTQETLFDRDWKEANTRVFPYKSIAFLRSYFPQGHEDCTGFFVRDDELLTNAHCLEEFGSMHKRWLA